MLTQTIKKVSVDMTPEDALKFKRFLANYEVISILLDSDIFSCKNANVTLHFDTIGTLRSIGRNDVLYVRKTEKISPAEARALADKIA